MAGGRSPFECHPGDSTLGREEPTPDFSQPLLEPSACVPAGHELAAYFAGARRRFL